MVTRKCPRFKGLYKVPSSGSTMDLVLGLDRIHWIKGYHEAL